MRLSLTLTTLTAALTTSSPTTPSPQAPDIGTYTPWTLTHSLPFVGLGACQLLGKVVLHGSVQIIKHVELNTHYSCKFYLDIQDCNAGRNNKVWSLAGPASINTNATQAYIYAYICEAKRDNPTQDEPAKRDSISTPDSDKSPQMERDVSADSAGAAVLQNGDNKSLVSSSDCHVFLSPLANYYVKTGYQCAFYESCMCLSGCAPAFHVNGPHEDIVRGGAVIKRYLCGVIPPKPDAIAARSPKPYVPVDDSAGQYLFIETGAGWQDLKPDLCMAAKPVARFVVKEGFRCKFWDKCECGPCKPVVQVVGPYEGDAPEGVYIEHYFCEKDS